MSKLIKTTVNKSAITGQFVSNKKVATDPDRTFKQTVTKKTENKIEKKK